MLSDTTVINEPPDMKQIPEFQLNINLTSQFINKFLGDQRKNYLSLRHLL